VVVIATDIATTIRRPGVHRGALHEATDQAAMFAPVVKQVIRVASAEAVGPAVRDALVASASAPTRPVYVEVPTDLLSAPAAFGGLPVSVPVPVRAPPVPDADAVQTAAALLAGAARPLIWTGGGAVWAGAGSAIGDLAVRLAAPVITTYQARGLLGVDHPCAVGVMPHVEVVGRLWDEADVVVAIGTDLDGPMTQNWRLPRPPALTAINVDAVDAAKNYEPDVTIVADAAVGTAALAARIEPRSGLDDLAAHLRGIRESTARWVRDEEPGAADLLDAFAGLPDEAVVVCDMCIPGYWLAAFGAVPAPRCLQFPMGWGTLGYAFPAAIGAALGATGPVVSVSGDGGFLYAPGELATIVQHRVPLTAVIVDDGGYGMLRFDQQHAGERTFGVDLHTPDFVALARAFGVHAEKVDGFGPDFASALARHVATKEPSVLVVSAALDPPPTTSPRWYRAAAATPSSRPAAVGPR
jgi:acetolactate synthase-1/2/3 large subunit